MKIIYLSVLVTIVSCKQSEKSNEPATTQRQTNQTGTNQTGTNQTGSNQSTASSTSSSTSLVGSWQACLSGSQVTYTFNSDNSFTIRDKAYKDTSCTVEPTSSDVDAYVASVEKLLKELGESDSKIQEELAKARSQVLTETELKGTYKVGSTLSNGSIELDRTVNPAPTQYLVYKVNGNQLTMSVPCSSAAVADSRFDPCYQKVEAGYSSTNRATEIYAKEIFTKQ